MDESLALKFALDPLAYVREALKITLACVPDERTNPQPTCLHGKLIPFPAGGGAPLEPSPTSSGWPGCFGAAKYNISWCVVALSMGPCWNEKERKIKIKMQMEMEIDIQMKTKIKEKEMRKRTYINTKRQRDRRHR